MLLSAPLTMQVSMVTANASAPEQIAPVQQSERNDSTHALIPGVGSSDDRSICSLSFFIAIRRRGEPPLQTTFSTQEGPPLSARTHKTPLRNCISACTRRILSPGFRIPMNIRQPSNAAGGLLRAQPMASLNGKTPNTIALAGSDKIPLAKQFSGQAESFK